MEGNHVDIFGKKEPYRYEGISTEALVHSHGISIDLSSENRDPDRTEDLPKLLDQLVANPENRIPTETGFCMDRVYIRDPLRADQGEQIMMFAGMPSHPDVQLKFFVAAGLKPEEQGLLERNEAAASWMSLAQRMRFTTLRAAEREIGGLNGEEVAELAIEENDARVHGFTWAVNGTEDNVFVPHILFEMSTGNGNRTPVPSSLSDKAALGLWDKMLSSIRLRPTQHVVSRTIETPTTALGTYASAGERCPESGWWLCSDGRDGVDVLRGQRQYIRKGDPMPQALLLPPRTFWDKMRGTQPSYESKNPTFWKLVDKRIQPRLQPPLPLASPVLPTGTAAVGSATSDARHCSVTAGMYLATGTPCPASGWWRCEDTHALDGTRWFGQGSLLPPATFTVAPGVFRRSPSAPQVIQRRSAWRLMRLADVPDQDERHVTSGANYPPPPVGQA